MGDRDTVVGMIVGMGMGMGGRGMRRGRGGVRVLVRRCRVEGKGGEGKEGG